MISVRSRDAVKGEHLSLNIERREMEETELEEGETFSYHNEKGYGSEIDPDIGLSHIDKKLQDLLGHFQKDFEGGVSAENLGAKFGGYGSFLPTYQRSPVWSHRRSPPRGHDHTVFKSQNNMQTEGGHRSSVSSSNGGQCGKIEANSRGVGLVHGSKTPSSFSEAGKSQVCLPATDMICNPASKCDSEKRRTTDSSEQKLLKFRIKMGSDNLLAHKNAAIYSGLGLDDSPSLDGSHSENEGMSCDPHESLDSPTQIIKIMTVLPVQEDLLMSPLADYLVKFAKDGKLVKEETSKQGFGCAKHERKSVEGKITKISETVDKSTHKRELSNVRDSSHEGINDGIGFDDQNCDDILNETMKLPLLSNSHIAHDSRKFHISPLSKDENDASSEKLKISKVEISLNLDEYEIQKSRKAAGGKKLSDGSVKVVNVANQDEGEQLGEERLFSSFMNDEADHKSRTHPLKHSECIRPNIESKSHVSGSVSNVKVPSTNESTEGKKKKVSRKHNSLPADVSEGDGVIGDRSGLSPKNKCVNVENQFIHLENKDLKAQKVERNIGEHYKDIFGETEFGSDDYKVHAPAVSDNRKPKSFKVEEKMNHDDVVVKDSFEIRRNDKPSGPKTNEKVTSKLAILSASESIAEVAQPVLYTSNAGNDNWVCCDKCQQWRLLPRDKNTDELPEKWLCSMLNWLPGMNSCRFTEEETTNALYQMYHVPVLENSSSMPNNGATLSSIDNLDRSRVHKNYRQDISNALPSGKKHSSKEISSTKTPVLPARSRNEEIDAGEPELKPIDVIVEKNRQKPKEKYKAEQSTSEKDDYKREKVKVKRSFENECHNVSKKIRTNGLLDDWASNHNGASEMVDADLSKDLLHISAVTNMAKNNDHSSSKDSSHDIKNDQKSSLKRPKSEKQRSFDDFSKDKKKIEARETVKKRKLDRFEVETGAKHGHSSMEKDDFSESEYKAEKKVKISKHSGKETIAAKTNVRAEKFNYKRTQAAGEDFDCTLSQRNMDIDCYRRNSTGTHPSLAANSSSSKVSGSHKSKLNAYEAKGSPVESVSSSPLRISKPEKVASEPLNNFDKEDVNDTDFVSTVLEHDSRRGKSKSVKKETACDGSLNASIPDLKEKNSKQLVSSVVKTSLLTNNSSNSGDDKQSNVKITSLKKIHDDGRTKEKNHQINQYITAVSGKGSSRSKDRNKVCASDSENGKDKIIDSIADQQPGIGGKQREGRKNVDEQYVLRNNINGEVEIKDSSPLLPKHFKEQVRADGTGHVGTSFVVEANGSHESTSSPRRNPIRDWSTSARNTVSLCPQDEKVGRNKAVYIPPSKNALDEAHGNENQPTSLEFKKLDHCNGIQNINSRNVTPNGNRTRDHDTPSSGKRDFNLAASNAIKEATNIKHKADRLKNERAFAESNRLYFEATLKFLYGASLLESGTSETTRNNDLIQAIQMYSSTANLCEYCAREYEKVKDMSAAALAYKCKEAAYMRVIFHSHNSVNRDRNELQTALQMVPPGESPSSSASDVDNVNHMAADKPPMTKTTGVPPVGGSHVIASRMRPNFDRLLNFTQDVNSAMEASRKSRASFAVARSLENPQHRDSISLVKVALDFNFHDMEELLHLVRVAFDSVTSSV